MTNYAHMLQKFPKTSLAFLPTPLQPLYNLQEHLEYVEKVDGPTIYIKRDDLTGLACGGNKTRKLEYLFADAKAQQCDTIITAGSVQSNHCRQTAAAAAQLGMSCHLLLESKKPDIIQGNVLLDQLFGAHIHWQLEPGVPQTLQELAKQLHNQGKKPYIIPYGGSNHIGTLGYVQAYNEYKEQEKQLEEPITHIVLASCSGGTQVGLEIGARLANDCVKIIGVSVDYTIKDAKNYQFLHQTLAQQTAAHLQVPLTFAPSDFTITYDYSTQYGKLTTQEREAIALLAQTEGILLDPVYTGRAFAGMLDMIRQEKLTMDDVVLFWHTGGTPALFAYNQELSTL